MPVNKDAMARYRIIDRMLADPHNDYTTDAIHKAVARECLRIADTKLGIRTQLVSRAR